MELNRISMRGVAFPRIPLPHVSLQGKHLPRVGDTVTLTATSLTKAVASKGLHVWFGESISHSTTIAEGLIAGTPYTGVVKADGAIVNAAGETVAHDLTEMGNMYTYYKH